MFNVLKTCFKKQKVDPVPSLVTLEQRNILLYLSDKTCSVKSCQDSNYIEMVLNFLADKRLHALLEEDDVKLFVRMAECSYSFKKEACGQNIVFVDDVFVRASKEYFQMLVSDCSALSFDFMASDRPFVFCNFDKKQSMALPQHCCVASSQREIFDFLSFYIKNDFRLEKSHKDENFLFISGLKKSW